MSVGVTLHHWAACTLRGLWINIFVTQNCLGSLEHPHPTRRGYDTRPNCGWKMLRALSNCFRATTLLCQVRGPVKLSLVCFILHSTCNWSIHYLRGTFGVSQWSSFNCRAFHMEKRNLSMSRLARRDADALTLYQTLQILWVLNYSRYIHPIWQFFILLNNISSILNNLSSIWMTFATIFIGDSILLWVLIIIVAHNIWSIWYSDQEVRRIKSTFFCP